MTIIRDWIKPSTTVISDCWGVYRNLDSQGYTHSTVNHSIHFLDPDTGDHTNNIESMWQSAKVFLGQYNRQEDYFAARCKAQGIPPILQFLHLVANTDWSLCDIPRSSVHTT
jgi:hypothetical protein